MSQNSETPSDASQPIPPETKREVKEYTLETIDWNDPYLRNIGPLRINDNDRGPFEPESATVEGQRIDFAKRSWIDGPHCPGCRGTWHSGSALRQHLLLCKPFDIGAMKLAELRLANGQKVTPDLEERYERYRELGLGPLARADAQLNLQGRGDPGKREPEEAESPEAE